MADGTARRKNIKTYFGDTKAIDFAQNEKLLLSLTVREEFWISLTYAQRSTWKKRASNY